MMLNIAVKEKAGELLENLEYDGIIYQKILEEMERALFDAALVKTRGNQSEAAHILGINRTTLRTKLLRYNMCK